MGAFSIQHPQRVWVRWRQTAEPEGPFVPDVPAHVRPALNERGECVPGTGFRAWHKVAKLLDRDASSPHFRRPLSPYLLIEVDAGDVSVIDGFIVPSSVVSGADKQLAELSEAAHQGRLDTAAEASFEAVAASISGDRAGFERNLRQAEARGLSAATAQRIAAAHGLARRMAVRGDAHG